MPYTSFLYTISLLRRWKVKNVRMLHSIPAAEPRKKCWLTRWSKLCQDFPGWAIFTHCLFWPSFDSCHAVPMADPQKYRVQYFTNILPVLAGCLHYRNGISVNSAMVKMCLISNKDTLLPQLSQNCFKILQTESLYSIRLNKIEYNIQHSKSGNTSSTIYCSGLILW